MFLIDAHQVVPELNPYSYVMLIGKLAFHEAHQNRRFADSRITNNDDLEETVIVHFLLVVHRDQLVEQGVYLTLELLIHFTNLFYKYG